MSEQLQLALALDSVAPGILQIGSSPIVAPLIQPLSLTWSLVDCETPAERAGLAGLALLVDWMRTRGQIPDGAILAGEVSPTAFTLTADAAGLDALLRTFYRWETVERRSATRNDAVHRTEEEVDSETGKTRTVYFWNQDQPSLPFLADLDICPDEAWLNLSRELVWRGLYSNRNARIPFYGGLDADEVRAGLRQNGTVKISGSSVLTAGSRTAEGVEFRTSARQAFLLRFWPLVASVFPVAEVDVDRSSCRVSSRVKDRRAIAIPDVADLRRFTRQWHRVMRERLPERRGIHPAAAIIDLPAEAALISFDDFRRVEEQEVGRVVQSKLLAALLGFEVVTIEKTSQSPRLHGVTYIAPERGAIDAYRALRGTLYHPLLRPLVLANAIAGRSRGSGTTRIARTMPIDTTIEDRFFAMDSTTAIGNDDTARAIRRMCRSYLYARMDSVGGMEGTEVDIDKWNREIRRTFVDARDLSAGAFPTWFSRTLGMFTPLGEDGVSLVVQTLHGNPDLCRDLTLVCLGSLRRIPADT